MQNAYRSVAVCFDAVFGPVEGFGIRDGVGAMSPEVKHGFFGKAVEIVVGGEIGLVAQQWLVVDHVAGFRFEQGASV